MKIRLRVAFIFAALASTSTPRADTVQASSTTLLLGRQDFREGSLQTAVPLYELVNLVASEVKTPYTSNVEIALSTWGSVDLAERRIWQNGALLDKKFTGDVNVGYVRAAFLSNALTLQIGRQMVADGTARMVQLDGGEARIALPGGFGLSGYAGSPVAPRWATRGGELEVGNVRATFATGGRASWRYPGVIEVGASVATASDRGDVSRRDVGADFRLTPVRFLALSGSGWWSLYEDRIGEAIVAATVFPVRHLDVTLDYRHVEPDLFLPRNSILSVFVADKRNDVGGSVHWGVLRNLSLDGDYHLLIEEEGKGHWARLKGAFHPGGPDATVGTELSLLKNATGASSINDNGYKLARLFAAKQIRDISGTLDLMGYFFDKDVNGQRRSLAATATLAYEFVRGWRAAVAGTAGSTPFLERQFEIMAKLVYNQTYATREVR